ncbi:MAG TPA: hypothetical protein VGR53_08765 [Nitrososphaerales archaeon]|nr:hypothetical protein [Nitrososphaerales archaeon]
MVGQGKTGQADAGSDVLCGNLFVVGGYGSSSNDPLDAVSVYSPTENMWLSGPAYPVKAWGMACSAVETSLFCFGGVGAGVRAYKFDAFDFAWTRLRDMPMGYNNSQGQVAVADANGSRVFIMGSSSNLEVNRTTLIYDSVNDSYVKKSDMPHGSGWFTAALYGGKIYAIGGTRSNQVLVYIIANDTWKQLPASLPGPPRFGMIRNPGVFSGLIPIVDGKERGTTFFMTTYFYDIAANRFLRGPDSLMARDGIAGGLIGDSLIVVGGRSDLNTPKGLAFAEALNLTSTISNESV